MFIGDLIKKYREEQKISQRDFAKRCRLSHTYIAALEKNIDVRTGKPIAPTLEAVKNIAFAMDTDVEALLKILDGKQEFIVNASHKEQYVESKIPVLGIVKAGYDYLAEENIIGYVSVNDNSLKNEDFFALKVKGNSMIPEIYENDIAIVKKQADFENGDYVVALINGEEATIKTGYKTDTGLLLRPANNTVPPLVFDKNDIEKLPVKIIGVVYNITRSFK